MNDFRTYFAENPYFNSWELIPVLDKNLVAIQAKKSGVRDVMRILSTYNLTRKWWPTGSV